MKENIKNAMVVCLNILKTLISLTIIIIDALGCLTFVLHCLIIIVIIVCIPVLWIEGLTFVQGLTRILEAYKFMFEAHPLQSTLLILLLIYEIFCKRSVLREGILAGLTDLFWGKDLGPRPTTKYKKSTEEDKPFTIGRPGCSGTQPFQTVGRKTRSIVEPEIHSEIEVKKEFYTTASENELGPKRHFVIFYIDEFKYKIKTLLQEDMNSKDDIYPNGKGAIYKLCEEYEGKVQYGYIVRVREIAFWLEEYFVNCKYAKTPIDTVLVDKLLEFEVF